MTVAAGEIQGGRDKSSAAISLARKEAGETVLFPMPPCPTDAPWISGRTMADCGNELRVRLAQPVTCLAHRFTRRQHGCRVPQLSKPIDGAWPPFIVDVGCCLCRRTEPWMSAAMKRLTVADPEDRMKLLIAERNRKMAASTHAYVRGSTTRFYDWLDASGRKLPTGPDVWICGDCHVGNLGPVASTDGALAIQIRDLDQTVIGNPAHDLIRLGLSLAMAARGSDLPGSYDGAYARMHGGRIRSRIRAGGSRGDYRPRRRDAEDSEAGDARGGRAIPGSILPDERIEGVEPVIPLGKRFWPLTNDERKAICTLFGEEPIRRLATSLRSREDDANVRVMDAAYWRKGCSSLGRLRIAVLVAIGKGKAERHCLMDLKEAIAAAAPRSATSEMPRDNAERVVTGARHLSPFLGGRMVGTRLGDKAIFVRELMPQDLKLEIEHLSREEAMAVAKFLARVVGRAHARQLNASDRQAWLNDLQRQRSKSLDAPSWLWNSIVELAGTHEVAYLEHCRRHALADAA